MFTSLIALMTGRIRLFLAAGFAVAVVGTTLFLTVQVHSLHRRNRILGATLKATQNELDWRQKTIAAQERKIHDDHERTHNANAIALAIAKDRHTADDGPLSAVARDGLMRLRAYRAAHARNTGQPSGLPRTSPLP
jgi:hypothetical protein